MNFYYNYFSQISLFFDFIMGASALLCFRFDFLILYETATAVPRTFTAIITTLVLSCSEFQNNSIHFNAAHPRHDEINTSCKG